MVSPLSVNITSPVNNTDVGIVEWVNGTSQNMPYGQELWLVVREGSLYFPMFDSVQRNVDGTWAYNTTIGKSDDAGKSFDVIVVLADSSVQEIFQTWYKQPYDLKSLPAEMIKSSIVTVTRK
jgi:hypothetical protein